ncbi:unnamed protein product [Paramecium pentaurelia]|uniref:Uncharacterized protein n=1 Tax=Paramecium pentaurelia TaxID=43138 RepID=A0A8S1WGQ4_9CILI|nr:unnamed protein product [Paramecium pentaurelia]
MMQVNLSEQIVHVQLNLMVDVQQELHVLLQKFKSFASRIYQERIVYGIVQIALINSMQLLQLHQLLILILQDSQQDALLNQVEVELKMGQIQQQIYKQLVYRTTQGLLLFWMQLAKKRYVRMHYYQIILISYMHVIQHPVLLNQVVVIKIEHVLMLPLLQQQMENMKHINQHRIVLQKLVGMQQKYYLLSNYFRYCFYQEFARFCLFLGFKKYSCKNKKFLNAPSNNNTHELCQSFLNKYTVNSTNTGQVDKTCENSLILAICDKDINIKIYIWKGKCQKKLCVLASSSITIHTDCKIIIPFVLQGTQGQDELILLQQQMGPLLSKMLRFANFMFSQKNI